MEQHCAATGEDFRRFGQFCWFLNGPHLCSSSRRPPPPFPHAFSDSPSSSGDVGEAIVSDSSVTAGVGIIFS